MQIDGIGICPPADTTFQGIVCGANKYAAGILTSTSESETCVV